LQQRGPVVDVDWLAQRLGDPQLVVLHVGTAEDYGEGHVPGARLVRLDDISAPMPEDGDRDRHLILQLPEMTELRATLEGLGISDGSTVAIVPTAPMVTQAARVLFTLDAAGFGARSVFVNGGIEAWRAAGHDVSTRTPDAASGRITRAAIPERVVEKEWILAGNAISEGFSLLDGRRAPFYAGERADRGKEGHIEGARSLPAPELFSEDAATGTVRLKDPGELRALFERAGVAPDDTVVAYCHIGQFATAVLMAARVLGHDVLLYDGSMNEWALEDLPVVR
jgi:thiosulfate/3-mercaptopyruvate sulfurtransferase